MDKLELTWAEFSILEVGMLQVKSDPKATDMQLYTAVVN
jgi:hypothetical protein